MSPGGPSRSAIAADLNVYCVASFVDTSGPTIGGITYSRESFGAISEPGQVAIALSDAAVGLETLPHEIGHLLLRNWGRDEHVDGAGTAWATTNVMHAATTGGRDLEAAQVQNVLNAVVAGLPYVRMEP
jgi:hypothetical protein